MATPDLVRALENFRRELRAAQRGAESVQLHGELRARAVAAAKTLREHEDWCTTQINEAKAKARRIAFFELQRGVTS